MRTGHPRLEITTHCPRSIVTGTFVPLTATFNGNFDLRSPFDGMRILVVKAEHSDDRTKYNTKFSLESSTQPSQKQLDEYIIDIVNK